ncbi:hypothetical protein FQ186_17545 [Pseudomonas sp. ANT_H14]|nr:hypothetical protein FQ182_21635 [Pseudomonas sp. ANT_H4]KAA0951165.1 hypothetical protein FQ186_17545 [Pseudomonas sp. ANT_H14]
MPIRPKPYTFVCGGCGWHKTVAPRSDALGRQDWFECCPACGKDGLERRLAGQWEGWIAQLLAGRRWH